MKGEISFNQFNENGEEIYKSLCRLYEKENKKEIKAAIELLEEMRKSYQALSRENFGLKTTIKNKEERIQRIGVHMVNRSGKGKRR